jgi:hypothetical protein
MLIFFSILFLRLSRSRDSAVLATGYGDTHLNATFDAQGMILYFPLLIDPGITNT